MYDITRHASARRDRAGACGGWLRGVQITARVRGTACRQRGARRHGRGLRAGQGPVELEGTAHAASHSFTSPLTQQECVAYRFVEEAKRKKRVRDHTDDNNEYKTKYEWETVRESEAGAPFYVDDGTGRVLVDGATAELDMERSYEVDSDDVEQGVGEKVVASVKGLVGDDTAAPDHEIPDEYVERLRSATHGRRCKEWVVHEGEEVYVYGEAVAPERTPLGSGVGGDLSAAAGAMGGGLVGLVKGLVGFGRQAATDPRTRYKPRAIQRLPEPDRQDRPSETEEMRDLADNAAGAAARNPRENPEAARELMDKASEAMQQAGAATEAALPDTPTLDSAPVVVSWGTRAPTFVVSDRGKKSVLRDYSTGVLGYGLLTVAGIAVAVGAVAWLLGLV